MLTSYYFGLEGALLPSLILFGARRIDDRITAEAYATRFACAGPLLQMRPRDDDAKTFEVIEGGLTVWCEPLEALIYKIEPFEVRVYAEQKTTDRGSDYATFERFDTT
jgi:hypothetical protein